MNQVVLFFFTLLFCIYSEGRELREERVAGVGSTTVYSGYGLTGSSQTFKDYVSDLAVNLFDNRICSCRQTGLWMYYDYVDYNQGHELEKVILIHGIDYDVNFDAADCGLTSSLRYGGNRYALNEDSFTIYEQVMFSGSEVYGNSDIAKLSTPLISTSNSIVITGNSGWTFYTGETFSGLAKCYRPDSVTDISGDELLTMNYGLTSSLSAIGEANIYKSVKKGCSFGAEIVTSTPFKAEETHPNGAWGVLKMR